MQPVAFLRLMQIFDSQFPTGGFVHSGGLESYAQAGIDAAGLSELLRSFLSKGFGQLDLAAFTIVHGDPSRAVEIAGCLAARKPIPTIRETSLRLGKRMQLLAQRLFGDKAPNLDPAYHPAVAGTISAAIGADLEWALPAFAQSQVTGMLAAATRCMKLSPGQAQETLTSLQELISSVCAEVIENPEDHLWSCTPAMDIRCCQQLHLYTRLFQS